jgi:hypothetical protein
MISAVGLAETTPVLAEGPGIVSSSEIFAESGQICSVGRRKIAKKIAKNKRCYANTCDLVIESE